MAAPIYTENELIKQCPVSEDDFGEFRKYGLISPILKNDSGTELYPAHSLEILKKLRQLKSMGYATGEISRIAKKVGLPLELPQENSDNGKKYITVGTLADHIGVNARTIKHWEDKGIIYPDARSEGGFRLYQEAYVYLGKLILDLQTFGYTLDEIKRIADMFRDFVTIRNKPDTYPPAERVEKLDDMLVEIEKLNVKMNALKEGIVRWEDLLKKKSKEIRASISKHRNDT
jgi:DNA-binding transcriptional MerR regulator